MNDSPAGLRLTRWTPLLLLLSLAVNLLLVGVFIGRWTMPFRPPPPGPAGMMRDMIDSIGRDMSDADRAVLQKVYQAHANSMEDRWADHRAAFDAIRRAMAAEPFDSAALKRAMDAAGQLDVSQRTALEQALVEAASQMSADGRQRMAGWQPSGPHGPGPGPH